jgi:hypothetical protein
MTLSLTSLDSECHGHYDVNYKLLFLRSFGRHDTQHNGIEHKDTRQNDTECFNAERH